MIITLSHITISELLAALGLSILVFEPKRKAEAGLARCCLQQRWSSAFLHWRL
jgi:hypothetical protein